MVSELLKCVRFLLLILPLSLLPSSDLCVEAEHCNSFDICVEKDDKGHVKTMHCRLSTDLYTKDGVETNFDCDVYAKLTPKKLTQKVEKLYDNPVGAGLTTFLSLLFLVIGAAVGFGAAYFVITKYFVSY